MSIHLFSSNFSVQLCVNFGNCHSCSRVFPLHFPLSNVVFTRHATHTHWAFCFQGSRLPLPISDPWSGFLFRVHITLQEVQAIALKMHRMAFQLSGKLVALQLDNSTPKTYLYKQGGTVSLFLSTLAFYILNLANKHGITLMSTYINTPLKVEANYLS